MVQVILPADISRNLMDFGSDPTAYLRQASANQIAGVTRVENNTTTPIVNTYNIQATLPNVKDPYDFLDTLPTIGKTICSKTVRWWISELKFDCNIL